MQGTLENLRQVCCFLPGFESHSLERTLEVCDHQSFYQGFKGKGSVLLGQHDEAFFW